MQTETIEIVDRGRGPHLATSRITVLDLVPYFQKGRSCEDIIRWMTDTMADRKGYNAAQKARVENVGILAASGLIAGEALMGLVDATFKFYEWPMPEIFKDPSYGFGFAVLVILAFQMVRMPLANAGNPDDPAPPTAIM